MTDRWVVITRPRAEAEMRLFCLPHAGGGAAVFRRWPESLPEQIEVCRIQPPGRETRLREPALRSMPELVEQLAAAVAPYLDRPFALFGHSLGALTAFELARSLRETHGLLPRCLFASAFRAPHLPGGEPLHRLPDRQFIDLLVNRYDGIPRGVLAVPELLDLMLPVLRADLAVCETYRYDDRPPLETELYALGGESDAWVGREHLEAWRMHGRGGFELETFPGPHFYLDQSHDAVCALVARCLQLSGATR